MKRRRVYFLVWFVLLLAWGGYAVAGHWVSRWVAGRAGAALLRLGKGKFSDPAWFVQNRLREMLWLVTLIMLWIALHWMLDRMLQRRASGVRWRWVAHGISGFVLLNGWIAAASQTALFWAALGAGSGIENYMQFNFKRILFEENRSPVRAVLVGSSQTRSEIDENLLNARLGTNLWTTELHFPGSKAYDLLLIEPQVRRADPQIVICYFSENYFYVGSQGETVPNFFTFGQLPDAWRRGALSYLSSQGVGYGLLGDALPLFRCREIISRRLLGFEVANLKQAEYDASLAEDLQERARRVAGSYRINAESDFQKQALEDFVRRCASAGRTVVLIDGGFNPILMQALDPAVRRDFAEFLNGLKSRHPDIVIIRADALARQTAADFEDLNHVTPDMQRRFTEALAAWLERCLASGQLAGRPARPE